MKEGKPWAPCLTMREGETVYDLSWFPGMTSSDAETCCFAATAKAGLPGLKNLDSQIKV